MAYDLYLNGIHYPVTPGKVQIKVGNNNKTITLINEGEVNVIKSAGLQEISFDLLLPTRTYPFTVYRDGFHSAGYYIEQLKSLKDAGTKFQFILSRGSLHYTNITVTLEDLTITDDAGEGFDSKASVKLKQWRDYGTKSLKINASTGTASVSSDRAVSDNAPQTGGTYTVQKGDCLWKIAQQYYGSGADYAKIYDSNSSQISDPNLIYPGQVLTIP
jgi:LysM repeat protein